MFTCLMITVLRRIFSSFLVTSSCSLPGCFKLEVYFKKVSSTPKAIKLWSKKLRLTRFDWDFFRLCRDLESSHGVIVSCREDRVRIRWVPDTTEETTLTPSEVSHMGNGCANVPDLKTAKKRPRCVVTNSDLFVSVWTTKRHVGREV